MTKSEVLNQLSLKEINQLEAYRLLFPKVRTRKARKAKFVKLKIYIPENKGVSLFINLLFFLPLPITLVSFFLRKKINNTISDQLPMSYKEFIDVASIKGARIEVLAKDRTKILIYTI